MIQVFDIGINLIMSNNSNNSFCVNCMQTFFKYKEIRKQTSITRISDMLEITYIFFLLIPFE